MTLWIIYGTLALMVGGLFSFAVLLIWALRLPRPPEGLEEFLAEKPRQNERQRK